MMFSTQSVDRSEQKEGRTMAIAAGIVAVVSQLFQSNDHTSVWLTFAIIWIVCALGAIASSSLVFRVAEVRKRVATQQRTRRR
jgi:ABC-type branched-subunit amino acid transport system permease subunit